MQIRHSISDIFLDKKPEGEIEKGKVGNSFSTANTPVEVFFSKICNYEEGNKIGGFTWAPGIYSINNGAKITIKGSNWKGSQIIPLDFDYGITPEQVFEISDSYNLLFTHLHTSMRDSQELRKFHALWILDEMITNPEHFLFIQNSLSFMFEGKLLSQTRIVKNKKTGEEVLEDFDPGEADPNAKKKEQIWFPGKGEAYNSEEYYNPKGLLARCSAIVSGCVGDRKKNNKKYLVGQSKSIQSLEGKEYNENKLVRNYNFDKPAESWETYRKFMNGVRIDHDPRCVIYSALAKVEGGQKWCVEQIMKCDYNLEENKSLLKHFSENHTFPLKFRFLGNKLEAEMQVYQDEDLITLGKAQGDFHRYVEEISINNIDKKDGRKKLDEVISGFSSSEDKRVIVECTTGLGKTTYLKKLLKKIAGKVVEDVVFACENHRLCKEFREGLDVETFYPIAFPELDNKEFSTMVKELYKGKRFSEVKTLISSGYFESLNDSDKIKISEFSENRRQFLEITKTPIVMTHEMFLSTKDFLVKQGYKIAYIDENISLSNIGEIYMDDLRSMQKASAEPVKPKKNRYAELLSVIKQDFGSFQTDLDSLIKELDSLPLHTARVFNEASRYKKLVDQWSFRPKTKNLKTVLAGFDLTVCVSKSLDENGKEKVKFGYLRSLPKDMRIMMLTATPDYDTHREWKVEKIKGIKHKCTVIFDMSITGSSISTLNLVKRAVDNEIPITLNKKDPVITTKRLTPVLKAMGYNVIDEVYSRNSSGTNILAGQNIQIFGGSRLSVEIATIKALTLGYEIPEKDLNFKDSGIIGRHKIKNYGLEYFANVPRNEIVRRIQINDLIADSDQAAGRIRMINHDGLTLTIIGGFGISEEINLFRFK